MSEYIYKKMYYKLFNAVTSAIRSDSKAVSDDILIQSQILTKEMFITATEDSQVLFFNDYIKNPKE